MVFDEFEKSYPAYDDNRPDQQDLLTMFSDSSLKGVMFLLTSNRKDAVSEYLIDRPARIKRWIDFTSPGMAEFMQVLEDKGDPSKVCKDIIDYLGFYFMVLRKISDNYQGFGGTRYGTDTLLTLAEMAYESTSIADFVEKSFYTNIPDLFRVRIEINSFRLKYRDGTIKDCNIRHHLDGSLDVIEDGNVIYNFNVDVSKIDYSPNFYGIVKGSVDEGTEFVMLTDLPTFDRCLKIVVKYSSGNPDIATLIYHFSEPTFLSGDSEKEDGERFEEDGSGHGTMVGNRLPASQAVQPNRFVPSSFQRLSVPDSARM